jgi:hypothetical protein
LIPASRGIFSVVAFNRWRPQRANRHDDPQPGVGALGVALATHRLDHLPRLGSGLVAMLRDPLMRGAMDVEVGYGHEWRLVRPRAEWKIIHGPASPWRRLRQ